MRRSRRTAQWREHPRLVLTNGAGSGDPPRTAIRAVLRISSCLLIAIACVAQVSAPLIGYYRDRAGALRQLHGVAGAFVPGPALESDAISVAWSGSAGFAKTERELLVLDANGIRERFAAPPGPAMFGFLSDGRPAWARFADTSCREFAAACPSAAPDRPVLRVRLPEEAESFEALGDGWVLARGTNSLYAVRTHRDNDQAYELPEAER